MAAKSPMRASPWASMVASSLACAAGNGIWMRWVASRLRRATTASRSAPRPGWGSVFAASTTSVWLAADAFIHTFLHSFAKRDELRAPGREIPDDSVCCGDLAPRPGRIVGVTVPRAPRARHRGGSLRTVELAQASVMGALCAVIAIISVVVPFAAGLALLGTVPTGLLAYRYRLRVLMAATVAAGVIAFLIAGLGGFMTVVHCVYIGGLTGVIKRKGRGTPTVIVWSLFAGLIAG